MRWKPYISTQFLFISQRYLSYSANSSPCFMLTVSDPQYKQRFIEISWQYAFKKSDTGTSNQTALHHFCYIFLMYKFSFLRINSVISVTFLRQTPTRGRHITGLFFNQTICWKHVITFHTAIQCFSLNQVFSLQTIITSDNDYTL